MRQVERIRAAADAFGGEVGISAWNGFAMVRLYLGMRPGCALT